MTPDYDIKLDEPAVDETVALEEATHPVVPSTEVAEDELVVDEPEVDEEKTEDEEEKEPEDAHAPALLNTVPTYAPPKEHTGLKDAADYEPTDSTETHREALLARLEKALDAAPDDVTAMLESRLASLVYEAESRVPGLVK